MTITTKKNDNHNKKNNNCNNDHNDNEIKRAVKKMHKRKPINLWNKRKFTHDDPFVYECTEIMAH